MATEVLAPHVPVYLAGEFVEAGPSARGAQPGDRESSIATTFQAGPAELERATIAAVEAFAKTRRLASYQRRDALAHVAQRISEEADELAELLTRESGKPIRDARGEVARAALTFRTAGEEALRITGEWMPLDWNAANRGRSGIVRRYPIGPVAGISPFNFPLNLAAHKVAPAIAAGLQHRPQAPVGRPAGHAARGALHRRDGPPGRRGQHPAHGSAHRGRHGPRRAVQAAQLHRLPIGRLEDEGRCRQEEGRPRAGWQRRCDRGRDRGPRLGGQPPGVRLVRLRRAGLHQRPAHLRRGVGLRRVRGALRGEGAASSGSAIRWIRPPTWGRWSMPRRWRAPTNG